ncbi:MAG: hypothetical protein ACFFEV_01105 [Candidatus Thorarchaeota archaeon]
MNDTDLIKTGQDAYRATMKDGFIEILTGFFFVMTPIIFIQPSFVSIFVVIYVLFLPQYAEIFRKKYTYPRVGYVKLRTDPLDYRPKALLVLLFIVIVSSGLLVMLMTQDIANYYNWFIMFPFILGAALLAPSAYLVDRTGAKIYWGFGLVTTILGLVISTITLIYPPQGPFDGLLAFSILLGVGLLIGGFIKFAYFLHSNPVIEIQEDNSSEQ